MDTLDTAANLAAVESAVAGVRWYRDDSPLEYIKAKGGKITFYQVIAGEGRGAYRCRMVLAWPRRPDATEGHGDTEEDAAEGALITLARRQGWRPD